MTTVGIKDLKDSLSAYLRRVRAGERVMVTDRGRPVALLAPLAEDLIQARSWELVDRGEARWGGGKPRGARRPPVVAGGRAAAIVLEDRR